MHCRCQINAMFVGFGGPFSLTCARLSRSMLPAIWLRLAADVVVVDRGSGRCSYTGVDVRAEVEVGPEKGTKTSSIIHSGDHKRYIKTTELRLLLNRPQRILITKAVRGSNAPNRRACKTPSTTLLNAKRSERKRPRSAFQSACSVKCRVSTHLPRRPTVI